MSKEPKNLGKLISIHGVSPVFLQRAVIVAVLSFIFFLAMMFGFYIRQNIGYFLLSTAFLLVYIFTMFGLLIARRSVLKIYENGLSYRKFSARWDELEKAEVKTSDRLTGGGRTTCEIVKKTGEKAVLGEAIRDIKNVTERISGKIAENKTKTGE